MAAIEDHLLAAMGAQRGVEAANRLCAACVTLLGVDAVAVSLVAAGANTGTLGASGPTARTYDEEQFTHGEGPCLDAVASHSAVAVVDLADPTETRWPAYREAMLTHHIRGVYAMPIMVAGDYVGAMDLFCTQPTMLSAEQVTGLLVAAELAQIPVLDLLDHSLHDLYAAAAPDSQARNDLRELTRVDVSQATGIVMAQLKIPANAALVRMRGHAYATSRSTSDVARDIIERRLRLEPH